MMTPFLRIYPGSQAVPVKKKIIIATESSDDLAVQPESAEMTPGPLIRDQR